MLFSTVGLFLPNSARILAESFINSVGIEPLTLGL